MQTKRLLQASVVAVLLIGWGITSRALAAEFDETLGAGASATDKYGLLCAVAPGIAVAGTADVTDPQADGVHFHVCINNADGIPGQCLQAPNPGSTPGVAGAIAVGGPGFYIVDVFKAPGGTVEPYTVVIACRNAANLAVVTPGAVFLLQDQ